ncbi:MAG TPA: 50S ribosomal protein L6 [Nannocystaceae bacterium]|nr:50S ribosomal protein L6 [Nannocystaceae bacterium]
MSRIGNKSVSVPKGVTVSAQGRQIKVKGPKGELAFEVPERISFEIAGGQVSFKRDGDDREARALHGMARAMTANMVTGVSVGFQRILSIVGVGYRAAVKGQALDLTLGFSHPVSYPLPKGVSAEVDKEGKITLSAADKALLGQVAADIRAWRPPEPYKGKGVRYAEEVITLKEGKARGKK